MTKEEFFKVAKSSGYAATYILKKYIEEQGNKDYTDDDILEVHRRDNDEYNYNYDYLVKELQKHKQKYHEYDSKEGGSF